MENHLKGMGGGVGYVELGSWRPAITMVLIVSMGRALEMRFKLPKQQFKGKKNSALAFSPLLYRCWVFEMVFSFSFQRNNTYFRDKKDS